MIDKVYPIVKVASFAGSIHWVRYTAVSVKLGGQNGINYPLDMLVGVARGHLFGLRHDAASRGTGSTGCHHSTTH